MSDELSDMINDWMEGDAPEVIDFAKIEPEHVSWLWPGRIPAGKLTVIDGDPSSAKSTLTIDLAARVSNGSQWPDGTPCPQGSVILLSAEDGAADTIAPRLIAAGANRNRVRGLSRVPLVDDEGIRRMVLPSLPRDIGELRRLTIALGAKLIIVDVLMAYLSGRVDAHRDQDVRGVLHQLADLAEQTGAAIILIRHLNKTTGGNALYRGGGSIGIVGAARSAFIVGRDQEDQDRLIMASTKSNLAQAPQSLAFRLVSVPELGCARVQWETEPISYSADQLLAAPSSVEDREEESEAVEWLRGFLEGQGGSAEAVEIYKAARREQISDRRLRRARKRAGVVWERKGYQGSSVWSLIDSLPSAQSGHSRPSLDSLDSTQGAVQTGQTDHDSVQTDDHRDQTVTQDRVSSSLSQLSRVALGQPLPVTVGAAKLINGHRPSCRVCGEPLPDSAIADGFDTHAACEEDR